MPAGCAPTAELRSAGLNSRTVYRVTNAPGRDARLIGLRGLTQDDGPHLLSARSDWRRDPSAFSTFTDRSLSTFDFNTYEITSPPAQKIIGEDGVLEVATRA